MSEFAPFFDQLAGSISLGAAEKELFASVLRIREVGRKKFVEEPGHVSRYRSFIVKGAVRAFYTDSEGQEHTMALAIENGWAGDAASFASGEPAALRVEAVEDTILVQWSYDSEQQLLAKIPGFSLMMFRKSQLIAIAIQRRVISLISMTAEQRFEEFERKNPEFLQRFPLYVIASYLGMTREFLSKIRNQKK